MARTFPVRFVTPRRIWDQEVTLLRLRDATGHFALLAGHAEFLTCLEPGLGYYRDAGGRQVFLAIDGGLLRVRRPGILVASREIFSGEDLSALSAQIDRTFRRRDESERAFLRMLADMEQAFLKKSLDVARGR